MKPALFKLAASAALIAVLAACGGGDEDPEPTDQDAILTLTSATDANIEGIYGTSNINLSEVVKTERAGTDDCSFVYDGVKRATDAAATLSGRIEYQDNSNAVQNFRITVAGKTYATADPGNTSVDRTSNRVRVTSKQLTQEAGGTATVTVSGIVPMRGSRPDGC
jgi:hypothetical protein